ncbi:MAG: hypothetical protein J5486_06655 [Bacteroidaceae bacterium]|nr:hypothetical protein [Bacteroidaceae bacterium]
MNIIRRCLLAFTLTLSMHPLGCMQASASTSHTLMGDSIIEDWQPVIDAIIEHESGGNTHARNGRFLGPMQIAPIMVRECNNILRSQGSTQRFTLNDRLSLDKSKEMFMIIMKRHNPTNSFEIACRIWKSGLAKTYSKATLHFIEEMKEIMSRQAAQKQ